MDKKEVEKMLSNSQPSFKTKLMISLTVGVVFWAIYSLIAAPLTDNLFLQLLISLPLSFLMLSIIGSYVLTKKLSSMVDTVSKAAEQAASAPVSSKKNRKVVSSKVKTSTKKKSNSKDNK